MVSSELKTLAIIYEIKEDRIFKNIIGKLLASRQLFTPIGIDSTDEHTYYFKDHEGSKMLKTKLEAAQELYIINPRGYISRCLSQILLYAQEAGKPVYYMYKYCYKDCSYRKGILSCALSNEFFTIPSEFKLLPACECYKRIYNDWVLLDSIETEPDKDLFS